MSKQSTALNKDNLFWEMPSLGLVTERERTSQPIPRPGESKLNLNSNDMLARGGIRKIYLYPGRDDVIVKVYRKSRTPALQKKRMHLRKLPFLRFPIVFDQNRFDLRELQNHHRRLGNKLWRHFPETTGIVATNHGPGLVQRRILNSDGTPAQNLYHHLNQFGLKKETKAALAEFRDFVSRHHIVLRDLSRHNLLFCQQPDGSLTVVMIDGFGNSDYLKFATLSRHLNDKKIVRKFDRLDRQILFILSEDICRKSGEQIQR